MCIDLLRTALLTVCTHLLDRTTFFGSLVCMFCVPLSHRVRAKHVLFSTDPFPSVSLYSSSHRLVFVFFFRQRQMGSFHKARKKRPWENRAENGMREQSKEPKAMDFKWVHCVGTNFHTHHRPCMHNGSMPIPHTLSVTPPYCNWVFWLVHFLVERSRTRGASPLGCTLAHAHKTKSHALCSQSRYCCKACLQKKVV